MPLLYQPRRARPPTPAERRQLAVAALLRPLWRRTQDTVNRRFSGLR
jgi:hypothetical protein